MKQRIDQLLCGYAMGDAISQEARLMRALLRDAGFDSDIYADARLTAPELGSDALPYEEYDPDGADAVVFHFSTQTQASALFADSRGVRILRYHNITPAHFFQGFDDRLAAELTAARGALAAVCHAADVCWSVSTYNASELSGLRAGCPSLVFPLLFSMEEFACEPDPGIKRIYDRRCFNWLFTGRIVPNKNIEFLIRAYAWFVRHVDANTRLIIAGSDVSCPQYFALLRFYAARLGLENVCFTGYVTSAGRRALYEQADVFVTASLHEGFCLPLVEAMSSGLPVVASRCGGMPETLGNAGLTFELPCEPRLLAEWIATLHPSRDSLGKREELRNQGCARVEELSNPPATEQLVGRVREALALTNMRASPVA